MEYIKKEECVNGCGDMETAYGRIYDNEDTTFFKVIIIYCPKCKYISYVDANL